MLFNLNEQVKYKFELNKKGSKDLIMENKSISGFKVKVEHGSFHNGTNRSQKIFVQEFTSRNHFSNYIDILPKDHWKTFEFGGVLKIIEKEEADYRIQNSDDFIVIRVCADEMNLGELDNGKTHIVEDPLEYFNIRGEFENLKFYEISNFGEPEHVDPKDGLEGFDLIF
jgi:hypothetical protein